MKRPSCKWKGQTDADEALLEARVARLAECHIKTEGGLQPTHQPHNCNPTILNILIKMKNNGLSDYTIKFTDKALTYLNKHANLNNPEEVKQYIANHKTSNHYKRNLSIAYNKYAKHHGLTWKMPKCKQPTQLPNIPKNRQP